MAARHALDNRLSPSATMGLDRWSPTARLRPDRTRLTACSPNRIKAAFRRFFPFLFGLPASAAGVAPGPRGGGGGGGAGGGPHPPGRRRGAAAAPHPRPPPGGAAAVWGPRPQNNPGGRLLRPPETRGPRARRPPAARALRLLLPLLFPSEIQIRFDEEDRPQVEPAYPHSQLYHVVCHHAVLQ